MTMGAILYIIGCASVFFEMITLMVAFREYLTWRFALTWTISLAVLVSITTTLDFTFPHVPLVLFNIVPLVLVNTFMITRLLYIRFIFALPMSLLLNAGKRCIGGIFGILIQVLFQSNTARITMRSNLNWHIVYQLINMLGAELLGLPVLILFGMLAHHWIKRYAFIDLIQHAQVDGYDYLVVALFFIIYVLVFYYDLEWALGWQATTATFASVSFGALDIYLVMNKNSQLNDAHLLEQAYSYNTLLDQKNQELHAFRHDYQNVLLSMSEYINKGDMPGLQKYFNNELAENQDEKNSQPEKLQLIDNPAVVGILYSKYQISQQQDVQMAISITDRVHVGTKNQINLVRILDNLLSNAMQSVIKSDHKIMLVIEQLANQTRFSIINELPPKTEINLAKVTKGRFTTSPTTFGYGLSGIEQLTTKKIAGAIRNSRINLYRQS